MAALASRSIVLPVVLAGLGVLIGVFLVVFGGYDDSPGAQLIGLVLAVASVVLGVWRIRRSRPAGDRRAG